MARAPLAKLPKVPSNSLSTFPVPYHSKGRNIWKILILRNGRVHVFNASNVIRGSFQHHLLIINHVRRRNKTYNSLHNLLRHALRNIMSILAFHNIKHIYSLLLSIIVSEFTSSPPIQLAIRGQTVPIPKIERNTWIMDAIRILNKGIPNNLNP